MGKVTVIASRVRNPLGVAVVILWVLYAIYKLVLSPEVFTRFGDNSVFVLKIIDNLFWLALATTVLGAISYIITSLHAYKRQPLPDEQSINVQGDTIKTQGDYSPGKVGGSYTVTERDTHSRRGKK